MAVACVLVAACAGVLAGCTQRERGSLVTLPPTPIVSLRPTWAVVTERYLRLRELPDGGAPISGHLRRGDVAAITAVSPVIELVDGESRLWYRVENDAARGWVLNSSLEAYASEDRARNAAERLAGG